jgi:WD40 repeat protein/tetratricopeptide (TPR) repeat protein
MAFCWLGPDDTEHGLHVPDRIARPIEGGLKRVDGMSRIGQLASCLIAVCSSLPVQAGQPTTRFQLRPESPKTSTAPSPETSTASRPANRRWAIIATPAVQRWGLSDLLTTSLSESPGIVLVEREQIDAALKELAFGEALDAEGVSARLKLGRLLAADALVFLRERIAKAEQNVPPDERALPDTAVELTVVRADQGIRVRRWQTFWTPSEAARVNQELVAQIETARPILDREDFRLFAVPPFESRDINRRYEELRTGYARLVEQTLMAQDGIAVVELAEAEAVARELAVAGNSLKRNLPYYVLGSYKTSGSPDVSIALAMELRRGAASLQKLECPPVGVNAAGAALRGSMDKLLKGIGDQPVAPPDMAAEVRLLLERAKTFGRVGEWDQAMPLYTAVLILAPDNFDAHRGLLEGFWWLTATGGFHPATARGLYYDPRGRMEAFESALLHLAALRAQQPADPGLSGKLERLWESFNLQGYDPVEDWDGAVAIYRRASELNDQIVIDAITQPAAKMKPQQVFGLTQGMMGVIREFYPVDPRRSYERMRALISAVDRYSGAATALRSELYVVQDAYLSCREAGELYVELVTGLERSISPRERYVGQVGRLLAGVRDSGTMDAALKSVDELIGSDALFKELRPLVREYIVHAANAARNLRPQPLCVPQINLLNTSLELTRNGTRQPARIGVIHDWLVCRPDLELFSTENRIYRMTAPGQVEEFFRGGAVQLQWDGRYVWAMPWKQISVLRDDGQEIVRYEEQEVQAMKHSHMFRYAPFGPGEMGMLGLVWLDGNRIRTWAGVLGWDSLGADRRQNRVQPFFQAREQWAEGMDPNALTRPFAPQWTLRLPAEDWGGEPLWVLDREEALPLIINMTKRTARVMPQVWPASCRAIRVGKTIYIASGCSARGFKAGIYTVEDLEQPPKLLVELLPGELRKTWTLPTFYSSMVYHNGFLHLTGSLGPTGSDGKPGYTWLAVDPIAKKVSVLAEPMPAQCDTFPILSNSAQYGIVIKSYGRAFSAALPPAETWPSFADRVRELPDDCKATGVTQSRPAEPLAKPGDETRLFRGHTGQVTSACFTPDGRVISAGWSPDLTLTLWDVQSGKELKVLQGHRSGIWTVVCAPDGRRLASSDFDGVICLWDLNTGECLRHLSASDGHGVGSLAFSPDGERLLASSSDGMLRMWDVESGRALFKIQAHPMGSWAVAFSHDGRHILSAGYGDGFRIRIADAVTGREIGRLDEHRAKVNCLTFSPDDKRVLSCSSDGRIKLWDFEKRTCIGRYFGNPAGVAGVAFLSDGRRFVSGGGSIAYAGWINPDGTMVQESEQLKHIGDNCVRVWDVGKKAPVARFEGHVMGVRGVGVSPDGRFVVSAGADKTVRLWRIPVPGTPEAARMEHVATDAESSTGLSSGTGGSTAGNPETPWTVLLQGARTRWPVLGGIFLPGTTLLGYLHYRKKRRARERAAS